MIVTVNDRHVHVAFFGLVFLCSCASSSCMVVSWHLDIANAQVMGLGT